MELQRGGAANTFCLAVVRRQHKASVPEAADAVAAPASVRREGHKPSATAEKHYRLRPLDLLRMWHTKIEDWILQQAGIEQPKAEAVKPKAIAAAQLSYIAKKR